MTATDTLAESLEPSSIDVRKLRQAKGWSIEKLASGAGVDAAYLARIEAGDRRPTRYFADHILRVVLGEATGFGPGAADSLLSAVQAAESGALAAHLAGTCSASEWSCSWCEANG